MCAYELIDLGLGDVKALGLEPLDLLLRVVVRLRGVEKVIVLRVQFLIIHFN
jgi:hypothetical protein